jgi:pimeloyl-ACP methyl ester carboxylesterase
MLVLHGIYGSGANWRTFARKLVARRPDWGLVLVDLRMHGRSQDAPPPHTVSAAAEDLAALTDGLAADGKPVYAVCGHSFGGKVALGYRARADDGLRQTWVLDASPAARPEALDDPDNTVVQVLGVLETLPEAFADRGAFVAAIEAQGFPTMLGQWLAMNLERRADTYVSRLDPAAMRALLTDYYAWDAWPAVTDGPGSLRVVLASRSTAVPRADAERLRALADADADDAIRVDTLDSGHWVHIEALGPLLDRVADGLPAL